MEGIRGTTHPLQTPIILECIFSNLCLQDLKNCRLVSKAWRKSGAVAMREIVSVHFDRDANKIRKFLKLVQNEESIFLESAFVSDFFLSCLELDGPEFFRVCGRNIKVLKMSSIRFDNGFEEYFSDVFFLLCPNMTKLSLQYINEVWCCPHATFSEEPTIWVPPRFPQNKNLKSLEFLDSCKLTRISYLEILNHFPQLEEITIHTTDGSSERIFQALATARGHNQQFWNIKSIGINFEDLTEPQQNLQPILVGSLKLECLDVRRIEQPEDVKVLGQILDTHVTSLKKLTVSGSMAVYSLDVSNQIFEKLKHLTLMSTNLSSTIFLRKFPNLQKLELNSVRPQAEFFEEPMNECVISCCTELGLNSKDFRKTELPRLFWRFPNLEKLTIDHCDNEVFSAICEHLPYLTYLHIQRNRTVDDAGITGLDKEDVERIHEEEANGWTWWRPITVRRPNLTSLKKLKSFRFDSRPSRITGIGACSALCGVQQLPQLKHLKLERCKSPRWNRLLSQFPWKIQ